MKITTNNYQSKVHFMSLFPGDEFEFGDRLYMVITAGQDYNCVNLDNGVAMMIKDNPIVTLVDACIVVRKLNNDSVLNGGD